MEKSPFYLNRYETLSMIRYKKRRKKLERMNKERAELGWWMHIIEYRIKKLKDFLIVMIVIMYYRNIAVKMLIFVIIFMYGYLVVLKIRMKKKTEEIREMM